MAKQTLKNENTTLHDMVEAIESDVITSQEVLREYICEQITNGNFISNVLEAVEQNTAADYFYYDYTCGNQCTPIPIYTKEDFINFL